MHPPSPTPSENDLPQGVLHIIQDVRNLRLDDNEQQQTALSWADLSTLAERHRLSGQIQHETGTAPIELESLNPAMSRLRLDETADTQVNPNEDTETCNRESPTTFQPDECHPDILFSTGFVDDLHALFPPPTGISTIPALSTMQAPPGLACASPSPGLSQASRMKMQRRRRRIASSSPTNIVLSFDYTRKISSKKPIHRKPFYQAIQPPSIASFFRPPTPRGRSPSSSSLPFSQYTFNPHHSAGRPETIQMVGYPTYIIELAEALGEGDNVYPLWYVLLTFWFPEQEGFEVVNRWTPRVPGEEGPGSEVRVFRPIEATLAVTWQGSPVAVVQIAPSQFLPRIEMRRSAERLFEDAALYSELPTLCVLEVLSKQLWGGFVRPTDAVPDVLSQEEGERDWDWFGPGWEKDGRADGCTGSHGRWGSGGRAEGQSVTSLVAFELLGRCFAALKTNCMGVS